MFTFTPFHFFHLLLCVVLSESSYGISEIVVASITWDEETKQFSIHDVIVQNAIATGKFRNAVNSTGWSFLDVTTSETYSDEVQAYAAGMVEGYLSRDLIAMNWLNTMSGDCEEPYSPLCNIFHGFFQENLDWVRKQIEEADNDPYWHQIDLQLIQVAGLNDGYFGNTNGSPESTDLDVFGFYQLQVNGDYGDVWNIVLNGDSSQVDSCSALIKLLPGNSDLYVAHDTWSDYSNMLRTLKKYDFSFHKTKDSKELIPGRVNTFSSQPGRLLSGDDFYLISSGLVTLETTIPQNNVSLWQYVKPKGIVLEGFRNMVANRLATSGIEWAEMFSHYNSGTYNNEWMVVDYKKFKPGAPSKDGLLVVLEQLPTVTVYKDLTSVLLKETYWGSYNKAYFPLVFNLSGQQEKVMQFGDWFTHDHTPRAKIFKRDQRGVTDLESMIKLMRSNDYRHDPLSRCNCTPPYSAANAISSRADLNPANGTYPFDELGHGSHGGTDMKLTNLKMLKELGFIAIGGPSYDPLPPFQWSKTDFASSVPHVGQPDIFHFKQVYFNGNGSCF